jgi:hypothetical protein
LNKSTRLNNKLALKIQNFSTNIPQTSALGLVQTNKSEHSSLTSSLVFDKACQVSLNSILFIERRTTIEDNKSYHLEFEVGKYSPLDVDLKKKNI